ncbi:unnamed protein product [Menidia menidia]|uniref:(Atlantic silverside) hypothetical protein n=1 Tax=Menidia menidia TaxID=238744 RepID=A0A8S4B3D5_9TELE|nr:unnamed protein product [Menidia menidia]
MAHSTCVRGRPGNPAGQKFFFKGLRMEDPEDTRLEEMLMCPVCQEIFKDPRQLPCGHSLCLDCLENMLAHSPDTPFRCPDCRAAFGPDIGVQKSYALSNIADDFRLRKMITEKQTKCVYCDCCPERGSLACKTCLKCEVSLCKVHVKDHLKMPAFTGHPLVSPLSDLRERKCQQHRDEVLKFYCNASRRYICNMCALESKRQSGAADASSLLQRQLTEYMDEHFKMLQNQITTSLSAAKPEKPKVNPPDSHFNCVTVILLFLWIINLCYAYNYSVKNQMLSEALEQQESHVRHIYSTIASRIALTSAHIKTVKELLGDHPLESLIPPDFEETINLQGTDVPEGPESQECQESPENPESPESP